MKLGAKQFLAELWNEIQEDNIFTGAAALSFYLLLSIFPAAIFLLSLLPYLPIADLEQAIMDLLHQVLPEQAAGLFQETVTDITSNKKGGGVLTIGFLLTLWSASSGLYAVMQQLNITYDVKEGRAFWKCRGIAILLTLLFFILVIGAFALVVFGGVIQDRIGNVIGTSEFLFTFFAALRWVIIGFFLLLGFAVIYYYGPDVEQDFRFITPGSVVGAILLVLASLAFRYYVSNFGNYGATYGSLGAVIILLMWLYMAGVVILLGSEINALIEHYHPRGKSKGENSLPAG